jgi:AraC-like DNA-binding protein
VRLTGALFFLVDAHEPWIAEAPDAAALAPVILPRAQHIVSYHLITGGTCWCHMDGLAPVRLDAGDIVVVPHGDAYQLSTHPAPSSTGLSLAQVLEWFQMMATGRLPFTVEEGGDLPQRVQVVCGFLGCDALPFNPVLSTLPRLLPLRRVVGVGRDRLATLIDFAVGEAQGQHAGRRSILLRLSELMFVEVVRRYLTTAPEAQRGWLAGLRDPLVGRALARLHAEPARAWTIEELTREVASSRTVLTERFTHLVGEPPMHYLTRWRIHLASTLLTANGAKVSAVARQVGYDSDAAFSRAFKKLTGAAPASWRHRQPASQR